MKKNIHTVTGAFGYSGYFIADTLLKKSIPVNTITNSVNRYSPLQGKLKAYPFNFDNKNRLVDTLKDTLVLYNNYWVRFNYGDFTHEQAVRNTFTLIDAAKEAGVKRFIHVSITNPSLDSNLEYFSGKARIEKYLMESGLSYCILRPAVLFGYDDILINNIAWILRHMPFFPLFGNGQYRLQPIHVLDLAEIAVNKAQTQNNEIVNILGPETFSYRNLVTAMAKSFEIKKLIFSCPPGIVYYLGKVLGLFLRDQTITRYEIDGLMKELLYVEPSEPSIFGKIKLSEYIDTNRKLLGTVYSSEIQRRIDRNVSYEKTPEK